MDLRPHEVLSAVSRPAQPGTELKNPILLATLTVAVATLARLVLDPLLRSNGPYLFFAIAVVIAALYAGAWAGMGAILLSIPICDYLFIEPRYTWFVHDARADSIMLVLFATLGVLTTFIIDRLHDSRKRLRESLVALQRTEAQLETIDAKVPEALFTASGDGVAEHLSGFFCKYSGRELHSLLGLGWLDLIRADDRDALLAELSGWQKESDQFERTIRLRRSDGTYRSFKCHAARTVSPDNTGTKWFGVCSDIENEEALAEALKSRTQELLRLNQSLEHFACAASHDLQQPLRVIALMTELFLKRKGGELDAESSQILALVLEGADRMKRLIDDILELARATNTTGENTAEVDMRAIAASAIADLRQAIDDSGAKIIVDQLPSVRAKDTAMFRLFENLIANAIKYRADQAPEILISAALRNEEYIFSVKDNGIGIDAQYHDEIFEPFRRLHGRSQYEGSGLGLAACRRIVASLNGRIWVESKLGEGSTFFFTIPNHSSDEAIRQLPEPQTARLEYARAMEDKTD